MNRPENQGKAWTTQEEDMLRLEFNDNEPIEEMVRRHGRNAAAIASRAVKLGLLADINGEYFRMHPDKWSDWKELKRIDKEIFG